MKAPQDNASSKRLSGRARSKIAGATLAEMMVAMILFALVATGVTASLIQLRKKGENAMSQAIAQSVAEGIMEQVRRVGFSTLSNFTAAATAAPSDYPSGTYETYTNTSSVTYYTYRCVELKFINVSSANYADVQTFNLYWAGNTSTYCEVGAIDSTSSTMLGVLLDVDYKDSSGNLIRPRRYMKMKVNLTRVLNSQSDAVEVILRYQWAIPDRKTGAGGLIYYAAREIRTVISKIPTY